MKKITPKTFLKKITHAKSAEGFLKQYREFMLTGELLSITTPIVAKIDSGELLPVPALDEIANAVYTHLLAVERQVFEASLNKESGTEKASDKPVVGIIFDSKGEEVESKSFNLGQDAMRWTDRHLVAQSPDCVGKVIHTKVLIKGVPMEETVTREDAYSRLYPRKKTPFMKRSPTSVSSLTGRMRVSQSRSSFSHG